jgi:lysozyme
VRICEEGIALVRKYEGEKLEAYLCPAGKWTIGVGHTGSDVREGLTITEEKSAEILRNDLAKFERCVIACLAVPVTQGQFSALVSFAFNVGCGAFRKSTLLRKLNEGDDLGCAAEFLRWTKSGGKVLSGLVKRRQAEMDLFLKG